MEAPEDPLCTSCGRNPSRHHLAIVKGGSRENQSLCDDCFEAEAPQEYKDELAAIQAASCGYCGAQAALKASTIDTIIGRPADRFACYSCFQEHHRFLLERLHGMEAGLTDAKASDQIQVLQRLSEETEAHMRDWVRQRDN